MDIKQQKLTHWHHEQGHGQSQNEWHAHMHTHTSHMHPPPPNTISLSCRWQDSVVTKTEAGGLQTAVKQTSWKRMIQSGRMLVSECWYRHHALSSYVCLSFLWFQVHMSGLRDGVPLAVTFQWTQAQTLRREAFHLPRVWWCLLLFLLPARAWAHSQRQKALSLLHLWWGVLARTPPDSAPQAPCGGGSVHLLRLWHQVRQPQWAEPPSADAAPGWHQQQTVRLPSVPSRLPTQLSPGDAHEVTHRWVSVPPSPVYWCQMYRSLFRRKENKMPPVDTLEVSHWWVSVPSLPVYWSWMYKSLL